MPGLPAFSPYGTGEKVSCKYLTICYGEDVEAEWRTDTACACLALKSVRDELGGLAKRRLKSMLGLIVTGVLAGIAGLVLFEAVCEGHGCSEKLRDRYHE
jgi:hypothetical protein